MKVMVQRLLPTLLSVSVMSVLTLLVIASVSAKTVTAKGTALIQNEDVAQARDNATSDALRKAVEMSVGSEVQTETVMENFELLNERIYSKSQGYISSYNVLNEDREANIYWVTVNAEVKEGALRDDLTAIGLLLAKKKMPRIMVMIGEETTGYNTWNVYRSSINEAENSMISILKERGFRVVDASTIQNVTDREAAIKALSGDSSAAAVIGRKVGVDIMITGKASAESGDRIGGSSMHSCSADVNARVIRADTGEIIATGSEYAVKPHINQQTGRNEALREAANLLSEKLIQQIIARWQSDIYSSNSIEVFLVTANADTAQEFKSFLGHVRGVSEVIIRDMSGNSAQYELSYRGDAEDMAQALKGKSFKGNKVTILNQTQNKLSISLQ